MAINFPDSPTTGQIYNARPGVSFIWRGTAWEKTPMTTALPKNYIINPAMMVSQENGVTSAPGSAANSSYYPADAWVGRWSLTGSTMTITRWAGQNTLTGSNTIYLTNNTVITPAAADYALISHKIEGTRVAELQWGTANAKDVVLRFAVAGNAGAGPYGVRIANWDASRSYVAMFTSAGWVDSIIAIPGDTTGTWLTDTGIGIWIDWTCAIGSNYHGTLGWQSANRYTTSSQFNGCSAISGSSNFHLSTVGLYMDPYKTGAAPPWQMPDVGAEHKRCQRYWYRAFGLTGGASSATAGSRIGMRHPVPMRVKPNAVIRGAPRMYDGAVTGPVSTIAANTSNYMAAELDVTSTASTFTGGKALTMYYVTDADYIEMNARV